jgi:hypothetical protein
LVLAGGIFIITQLRHPRVVMHQCYGLSLTETCNFGQNYAPSSTTIQVVV